MAEISASSRLYLALLPLGLTLSGHGSESEVLLAITCLQTLEGKPDAARDNLLSAGHCLVQRSHVGGMWMSLRRLAALPAAALIEAARAALGPCRGSVVSRRKMPADAQVCQQAQAAAVKLETPPSCTHHQADFCADPSWFLMHRS